MRNRTFVAGVLVLSAVGAGYAAVPASDKAPVTAADEQDQRESKLIMLKLPAMV